VTEPIIRVSSLNKSFGRRRRLGGSAPVPVLRDVTFSVAEGETLGIVGESGSGKSTTAYCLLRLLEPDSGSIVIDGTDMLAASRAELRALRRSIQIVFQDPYASLDPRMRVGDIVSEPLWLHGVGDRRSRVAAAASLLERVGLRKQDARRYPSEFSGGQRQRIGIARALALQPRVIVCDEPVSALDVSVQAQIINLLKDLQEELRLTLIFISHDLAVVRTMSDNIVVMRQGEIVESGTAQAVYAAPRHAYTRALLQAHPVPDPGEMRRRRSSASGGSVER
jgi:ABC-type oligopeptide transport system ATPase subunit